MSEACNSHVQYDVKVSVSGKKLKSVRGNYSSTGTGFMKRRDRHVPIATDNVDSRIEHGGKSCVGIVECNVYMGLMLETS